MWASPKFRKAPMSARQGGIPVSQAVSPGNIGGSLDYRRLGASLQVPRKILFFQSGAHDVA